MAEDGQVLLTAYADSVPGTVCPSKVQGCPHKTLTIQEAQSRKPVTRAELVEVKARLDRLEPKVRP